jgi:5'-nucleotidase / UDP-sugar diphosphatase
MNTYQASKGKYEGFITVYKSDSIDKSKPTVFGGNAQEPLKFNHTIVIVAGEGQYIKLANTEIQGNIVIKGDETDAGTVYLDNVKVSKLNKIGGSIIVDNVADHSLYQTNVTAEELKVNDSNGANIVAESGTKINSVLVAENAGASGSINLESKEKGTFGTVELASKGTEKSEGIVWKGDFSESSVSVTGEGSTVKVAKDATIKEIDIKTAATLDAASGANVQAVNLAASEKWQKINIKGDLQNTVVNVSNANADVKVAENTVIKEVKKDSSIKEEVKIENN